MSDCGLTNLERLKGTLCRSMKCQACRDIRRMQEINSYISKKDHEIIVNEALSMGNRPIVGLNESAPETYLKLKGEIKSLQSKVEQLEKLYKKMIFTTKGKHANNDSIQMMLIRGHLDDMAKILEQR